MPGAYTYQTNTANPPIKQLLKTYPRVQAIPPHKNWDSILSLIEIQHSKKHWSLFSSKHIPQHWWLKNRTVLTQFNPKCCLSYGTAQKHPSWLGCSCAGHCKERQADTISCSLNLLNLSQSTPGNMKQKMKAELGNNDKNPPFQHLGAWHSSVVSCHHGG